MAGEVISKDELNYDKAMLCRALTNLAVEGIELVRMIKAALIEELAARKG